MLLHADDLGVRAVAVGRRFRLLPPVPPTLTYDWPVERIAAGLRRLSAEMRQVRRGTSAARWHGLRIAYDDLLVEACRALEVPNQLGELGDGMDREAERIRVEVALERAGLAWRDTSDV